MGLNKDIKHFNYKFKKKEEHHHKELMIIKAR
jgi:hypothetical protein